MKKIITLLIFIVAAVTGYSQVNATFKTFAFPLTGTAKINKVTLSLAGNDTLCTTCIPSSFAVNQRLRSIVGGGAALGTVTLVSGLSPLFTTSNASTTPTFALSNAAPYTVFGRAASSGAPSYLSSLDSNWIPALHSQQWYATIFQGKLTITTTGTGGASTLVGNTLNIPQYDPGITFLNGLSVATQTFATGTSGTDFGIVSSAGVHTFNVPTASASVRGLLSSANWTTFNNKQPQIVFTTIGTTGLSTFSANTLNIPNYQGQLSVTTTGTAGASSLIGNTLNIPIYTYTLPTATSSVLGGVKVDMSSIIITGGVISAVAISDQQKEFITTNATTINADTILTNAGTYEVIAVEVECVSKLTTGVGGYHSLKRKTFDFTNPTLSEFSAGTIDAVSDEYRSGLSSANVDIVASGVYIIVKYTGEASKNIQTKTVTRVKRTTYSP